VKSDLRVSRPFSQDLGSGYATVGANYVEKKFYNIGSGRKFFLGHKVGRMGPFITLPSVSRRPSAVALAFLSFFCNKNENYQTIKISWNKLSLANKSMIFWKIFLTKKIQILFQWQTLMQTARFYECKQLFEYQHLLLLRDIW